MIGISANSVEAAPRNRRAMSTSVSSKSSTNSSNTLLSEENSVQQNMETIQAKTIFKSHSYDIYSGTKVEIKDLIYESAYSDFSDLIMCIRKVGNNVEIKGGTVVNPTPQNVIINSVCIKAPETIVVSKDSIYEDTQVQFYAYEFDEIQNKYKSIGDYITLTVKSNEEVVIVTKESYENMRNKCKDLDIDTLKTVKNLLTASTITSGISTAGGIANTVMGGISLANNKSEEDKSETNKKLDLATTIVSGVSTVSSGTATATSAVAISKVNDAIDKVKDCTNAINNLIIKID